MDGNAPEIKRGRKFAQVVAGAREVFLAQGFEGASVDLIAKRAGVSKATLYAYFPDKRALFIEVTQQECACQSDRALSFDKADLPIRAMLEGIAHKMLEFLTSDFAHRIFRICVAEAERFPELGRAFYMSGPQLMRNSLKKCFEDACGRGELEIKDVDMAACYFMELVKADIFPKMVFNVIDAPDQQDLDRVVDGAVEMFLARYGV